MYIQTIQLRNWKAYASATLEFPKPGEEESSAGGCEKWLWQDQPFGSRVIVPLWKRAIRN